MKIIFTLLLFIQSLFAYESVEVLDKNIVLHGASHFRESSDMYAQDVFKIYEEGKFKPLPKAATSFGFQSSTHWFAFDISYLKETENSQLYLYIRHNLTENATLYTFKDSILISEEKNGYLTPINERRQKRLPIEFKLNNNLKDVVYLLKIDSKHPHFTSFVIAKDDILDEIHLREYFIFIFFSGLIFAMILYNLILYFSTRDKLYLHYIVYVIGAYSLIFFMHGYLPLLTDKLALQTPFFITLSVQIELIGLVLFTNLFLNLKENESKLWAPLKTH